MKKIATSNILLVAAHPDDEVLGAGGTLCRHRDAGDKLAILLLANGEDSRDSGADPAKRWRQAQEAAKRLRAKLYTEDLPDNQFDSVPLLKIAKAVERVKSKTRPDIVYTHSPEDLNIDHRLTCQAVLVAFRPQPKERARKIFAFETLSSTEWQVKRVRRFAPNYYVNISRYLSEKKKLLSLYEGEMRNYPHPRSLEGVEILAKYRGLEVGLSAAEAFQVLRIIED